MSTSTDKSSPMPEIHTEDIIAYFSAKKVSMACPMCQTTGWLTLNRAGNLEDSVCLMALDHQRNTSFQKGVIAFCLLCANCGFIWLTERSRIEKWVEQKGVDNVERRDD